MELISRTFRFWSGNYCSVHWRTSEQRRGVDLSFVAVVIHHLVEAAGMMRILDSDFGS